MTTGLQAITKVLKSATSRWEAVEPAFLKLPEGQVVIVHLLNHGHQSVAKVEKPEDITTQRHAFALSHVQILGYYRFDGSTWELASDMLDAIDRASKDEPELFEEQLLTRLLVSAAVRADLTTPVPEDMEEFFLHRVGDEQCVQMAVAGEDFALVPERPLGCLMVPKGTVALYWPAIEKERENVRAQREMSSSLAAALGAFMSSLVDENNHDHEHGGERKGPFGRMFRRRNTEPAPGMGASEGKDFRSHESEDRGEQPYVTAGLAGTRKGEAASDIG